MSSVNGQAKAGAPAQDILRMEHITKIYGNGFIANNGIDFSVRKGEIHALAGENGAGKSTPNESAVRRRDAGGRAHPL